MPELSATSTEATISRWLKSPGDAVREGEVLVEVESEKATLEIPSPAAGWLARILAPDGTEGVKVGARLAVLAESREELASLIEPADGAGERARSVPAPVPEPAAPGRPAPAAPSPARAVAATPLARRMAEIAGLALADVQGTGPAGRVVRADVERALGGARPRPAARIEAPAAPIATEGAGRIPHTPTRRTIARRLAEAKRTIPHFYLTADCRVDALVALRADLNAALAAEGAPKLSLNDFVVRAAALALRRHRAANASWTEEATVRHENVDIACAVATDKGLITPIVRDADRKSLVTLSAELRALAERARAGRLAPEEFQGGTFTVSNLGMYEVDAIHAIINPPHACVLGVGAARAAPVVVDGELRAGTLMTCTLSADHRVLDGAEGARFLAAVRGYLERPAAMLL